MPNRFTPQIANALGLSETPAITTIGTDALPSYFAVTELACASIGMAAAMISNWRALETGSDAPITVDQRLASKWFNMTIRPQGWTLPNVWDPLAGDYPTRDGWIRLHTNAPHHRAAALSILGDHETRDDLAMAVRDWQSDMLESQIVAANGCAATMHSLEEWQVHPQGISIATDPLICWDQHANTNVTPASIDPARPLRGIRVLDLTRILAGPVAGRFLAAFGADVLRIDPPGWDEGAAIPEVTLGKRCAGLDLRDREDRKLFEDLISGADILLHGYRPDALAELGYDAKTLRAINPALIDVTLSAYGWTGPWAKRRGFDSLVQMSCGIADWGMTHSGSKKPLPLPVQALDHATGYLMAASAVRALIRRATRGEVTTARHSLARTAHMLRKTATPDCIGMIAAETDADIAPHAEVTDWGPGRRIAFPVNIAGTPHYWHHPAGKLHRHAAHW
ncbi:CoA transferase [Thalassospira profundimaris]|uniref:CoA transferase n=1 Tax=Thalassospira profundimaris TaxID=502049 RepID=UPI0002872D4D|nr:CoA transferase [Thalassospira profundimaris]EKF07857.1 hypothetical protein TH2_12952 [Thalassospira profundimaris WP0211]